MLIVSIPHSGSPAVVNSILEILVLAMISSALVAVSPIAVSKASTKADFVPESITSVML